jgi:hypothetical protein
MLTIKELALFILQHQSLFCKVFDTYSLLLRGDDIIYLIIRHASEVAINTTQSKYWHLRVLIYVLKLFKLKLAADQLSVCQIIHYVAHTFSVTL